MSRSPTKPVLINGAARVPFHRLPVELLVTVIVEVLDQAESLAPIAAMSLVCRRWHELATHDHVWAYVARHYFVAFPLIRQVIASSSGGSPLHDPAPGWLRRAVSSTFDRVHDASTAGDGVRVIHRRTASGERRRPTKTAIVSSHSEIRRYLSQREHAHRVAERRRYVLHLFLSFTLFSIVMALVCFIAALEASGASAPPRDWGAASDIDADGAVTATTTTTAVVATGPLSIENGFNFLWATFVLVLATVVANIVMKAHFEPRPLFQRLHRHGELIVVSTTVLGVAVVAGGVPLYLLQCFCLASEAERAATNPWLVPLPTVVAALVWQASVAVRFRTHLRQWWAGALQLTPRRAYEVTANSTPLYLAAAMVAAVAYYETRAHAALVAGALIPFVACAVLGTLFLLDFVAGAKGMNGLASASLYLAAVTPALVIGGVIRGVTMLPVAVAAALFFAGHAQNLLQLLNSVDELEVLIASGRSSADDDDD